MEPQNSAGESLRFAVSVSRDRDQFFRLTCPSCGRDFKILIDQNDLQWALSSYCRRMGCDIGPESPGQPHPNRIRCPYCGNEDETVRMHTEETVAYLKRTISRELVIPLINRWASGLEQTFGGRGHSEGLLSISIGFKHSRSLLPVRPIHGPEIPDLKIVTFLCCGKKAKISEGWTNVRMCPFCGADVALI